MNKSTAYVGDTASQHLAGASDLVDAQHADHGEPHDHDRAEDLGDPGRAALLHGEQADRITTEIGITQSANAGVATSKPSTAESTEIAGVISPSPYSSAVPNTPSVTTPAATLDTV